MDRETFGLISFGVIFVGFLVLLFMSFRTRVKLAESRKETAKDFVYQVLGENKVLDEMASGDGFAYIAVTDSKVVLATQHWQRRRDNDRKVKTYPLDQIASVDVQQRRHDTDLEIGTTGGVEFAQDTTPLESRMDNENILTWPNSEYSRVQQLAQTILDARAAFIHGQKPSVQPVAESITDQIGKLAELHKQGILSDEEFSEKKTELLKRM